MVKKWLATFAVAGLVLAGCGGSTDDENGGGGSNGDDTDNAQVPSDLLTAENFGDRVLAAQQDAESFEITMQMVTQGETVDATGAVLNGDSLETTQMQLNMEVPGAGTAELRLVDGIMYMQIPDLGWVSMDLGEAASTLGMDPNSFNPAGQIEAFNEALISLEASGEPEEIDGVQAQPYTLLLDTQALQQADGLEGFEDADLPDQIEAQMWVGPDDLPRRVVTDLGTDSVTMTMSNWGTDVSVEAPPADEVMDFGELLGG